MGADSRKTTFKEELVAGGFMPLPITSRGKQYVSEVARQRVIVAKALNRTLDDVRYVTGPNAQWDVLWNSKVVHDVFDQPRTGIYNALKRTERYLHNGTLRSEGIRVAALHRTLRDAYPEIPNEASFHAGANILLYYKNKDDLICEVRKDRKIVEVKFGP